MSNWKWKDNLSPHFTYGEMVASQTAARQDIDNTPQEHHVQNFIELCDNILEPIRLFYNRPVLITSGYRSPALNEAVGGSDSSQHMKGEAADFIVQKSDIDETFQAIATTDLPFDQMIWEYGRWIHISHTSEQENRQQILVTRRIDGRLKYVEYNTEEVTDSVYLKDISNDKRKMGENKA